MSLRAQKCGAINTCIRKNGLFNLKHGNQILAMCSQTDALWMLYTRTDDDVGDWTVMNQSHPMFKNPEVRDTLQCIAQGSDEQMWLVSGKDERVLIAPNRVADDHDDRFCVMRHLHGMVVITANGVDYTLTYNKNATIMTLKSRTTKHEIQFPPHFACLKVIHGIFCNEIIAIGSLETEKVSTFCIIGLKDNTLRLSSLKVHLGRGGVMVKCDEQNGYLYVKQIERFADYLEIIQFDKQLENSTKRNVGLPSLRNDDNQYLNPNWSVSGAVWKSNANYWSTAVQGFIRKNRVDIPDHILRVICVSVTEGDLIVSLTSYKHCETTMYRVHFR